MIHLQPSTSRYSSLHSPALLFFSHPITLQSRPIFVMAHFAFASSAYTSSFFTTSRNRTPFFSSTCQRTSTASIRMTNSNDAKKNNKYVKAIAALSLIPFSMAMPIDTIAAITTTTNNTKNPVSATLSTTHSRRSARTRSLHSGVRIRSTTRNLRHNQLATSTSTALTASPNSFIPSPEPVAEPPAVSASSTVNPASVSTSTSQPVSTAALTILPARTDTAAKFALKVVLLTCLAVSLIIAVTVSIFWIIQDSLVYKPTKVWRGNPKSSGMPYYDDVNYVTSDGVEIYGWFIKQAPEKYTKCRTLIYFHGTDKNASFRLKKVLGFYETCECNILLLSYRGYGLSTGNPNESGLKIDAESALHYLVSRGDIDITPGGSKLWVYGESLGGAVALHFTDKFQSRINALILENTFTSLLDMIKLEFPILGVFRYLSRNRWTSNRRISRIRVPILFLSGLRDTYIPPAMMRRMHTLASRARFREFIEFENGTHNRTWTMDGFYTSVQKFMHRVETEFTPTRYLPSVVVEEMKRGLQ